MTYRILSKRMDWPAGSLVDAGDLADNITMLLALGKIEPVEEKQTSKKQKVQQPEPVPALEDDSAEEPEEQE